MLNFNSALLSVASDFVGQFAPYQSVEITPAPEGGVFIASTDKGNIACLAFDPSGTADESTCIIPSKDLMKATKGIKTGDRNIQINDDQAVVTTYKKTTANQVIEVPVMRSTVAFAPLSKGIQNCLDRWSNTPTTSPTAGRYNLTYINKALRSLSVFDSSIALSAFDGGPLRIQGADNNLIILVMPQTAEPIPKIPYWLEKYACK